MMLNSTSLAVINEKHRSSLLDDETGEVLNRLQHQWGVLERPLLSHSREPRVPTPTCKEIV